jgi:hypothetical protein
MVRIALFLGGLAVAMTGCDTDSSSAAKPAPWCPYGEHARHGKCVVVPASIDFDGEATFQSSTAGFDGYRGLASVGGELFSLGTVWSGASTSSVSGVRAVLAKAGDSGWQNALSSSADWSQGATLATDGTSLYAAGVVYGSFRNGLVSSGDADAFIAKLNPADGSVQAAVQFGSTAAEWVEGSAVVAGDAIYLVGTTSGTISGVTSSGEHDVFVAKYSLTLASQTPIWVKQLGTEFNDFGRRVAVDASGHLFVAGITLKNEAVTPPTPALSGGEDTLLWRLDPANGSVVWTRRIQTPSNDRPSALVVDTSGNPVLVGMTLGKMGTSLLGGADLFVTKFSLTDGDKVWGPIQFGSKGNDIPEAAVLSADNGTLYVVGATDGSFGGEDSHVGGLDGFVVPVLMADGSHGTVRQFGSLNRDVPYAVTLLGTSLVVGGESEGNIVRTNNDGLDSFWVKYATPF